MQKLQNEALLSFSLASIALARGRQDEYEKMSKVAIDSMKAATRNPEIC